MKSKISFRGILFGSFLLVVAGCYKPMNLEKTPVPPNTLILEFARPVKFVMDLYIDGNIVPIQYSGKNRILMVEGLKPGNHFVNIHSISYVFGPEFDSFHVDENGGSYFFIQSRKYRSGLPKNRAQVSIRAYRKQLKKEGINVKTVVPGAVRAYFR